MSNERPAARSFIGMFILIFGLAGYAFLIAAGGDFLIGMPMAIQFFYYLITGVVWILPVGKLLRWMADAYKK